MSLARSLRTCSTPARAAFFISVMTASSLRGQTKSAASPSSIRDAKIDITLPATFTRIASVRELSDERVLVSDVQARMLYIVGPRAAGARQLGRQGDGPGEYRSPSILRALGGDTTLVVDATNRKWYLLDGDRFIPLGETFRDLYLRVQPDAQGTSRAGGALQVRPLGPIRRIPMVPGSPPELADSLAFVLYSAEGHADTLARGKSSFLGVTSKDAVVNGATQRFAVLLNPLQTNDQAILFADGAVAVAYVRPYRVDWRSATGSWTRGTPIAGVDVPLTDEVKRRIASNYQRDVEGKPVFSAGDFPPWPREVPAFGRRALFTGADGRLFVVRVSLDDAPLVDVFDRTGRRTESIRLPINSRLIGVGARGLYVATKNPDEEEIIQRLR